MNILDENIPESQRQLLRSWRIRVQQIGHELGHQGMKDDEIIPLLHQLRRPTFFTRDLDFYDHQLCHAGYCVVCLAVGQYETASFIRRFLLHSAFNTQTKRRGSVVRVSHTGMRIWRIHVEGEEEIKWAD
jgi:hypothetical protein